jgi:energy-coupling factor transporter ATP-binding protein EcfA2
LLKLNRERGTTLLLVTHDQQLADLADRKISLSDGRVIEDRLTRGRGEAGTWETGEADLTVPGLPELPGLEDGQELDEDLAASPRRRSPDSLQDAAPEAV